MMPAPELRWRQFDYLQAVGALVLTGFGVLLVTSARNADTRTREKILFRITPSANEFGWKSGSNGTQLLKLDGRLTEL